MDNIALASDYRFTATIFRMSATILFNDFLSRGEILSRNVKAIPFYYMMPHSAELLLKCVLLKRDITEGELKKFPIRHNLSSLLARVIELDLPISDESRRLLNQLSEQHERHELRYLTFFSAQEKLVFTPDPEELFAVLDELLLVGRISTYGR
jgi:hypothetical protein